MDGKWQRLHIKKTFDVSWHRIHIKKTFGGLQHRLHTEKTFADHGKDLTRRHQSLLGNCCPYIKKTSDG